ncbi:GNAT family N-acetyltransferase [Pseudoalteromonas sp.]|uniref:GNAT family N-acetyltransferase n=1 Tax=Pseudoalteromonas sp. TaxID=53249 RepID=UPI003563248D
MISYPLATNLDASAAITYQNMRPYYKHYAVNWQQAKIRVQIAELENWDILYGSAVVGAAALAECERLAANAGVKQLRLRVFKISPAYHLYIRNDFAVDKQHDNFFYMSKNIH